MRVESTKCRIKSELPIHIVLFLPMASIVFLLYYLLSNTLKPTTEFYQSEIALPTTLDFSALINAAEQGGMLLALRNSVIISIVSVVLAGLFGAFASFALSHLWLPAKRIIFIAMIVPMAVAPMIVTIPLFSQLTRLGLINTFAGGIIVFVGLRLSFTILVLEGAFRELPNELFEAAAVDGANSWTVFWRILFPTAAPSIAAVSIFNGMEVWNDLLVGLLFMSEPEVIPISAHVVSFQQKFSADPQLVFAGLTLGAAPLLLAYLLAQRFFVRGLMGGAFK